MKPQMSGTVTEATLTTQEISDWTKKLNYGTWRYQKSWNPLHIVDAEGCYLTDSNGKRYLDFSAQPMCCNLGHKNPAVIEAIERQARSLMDVSCRSYHRRPSRIEPSLARRIACGADEVLLHDLRHGCQ